MRITLSSVRFNAPFMFADPEDLRKDLLDMLATSWESTTEFQEKFGQADLDFIIVVDKNNNELKIKGPTKDSELVDFAIWLPYKKIKNSENYRLAYLDYVKQGVIKVLEKYKFELEVFENIFYVIAQKELTKNNS